ncbi:hypothetical protein P6166_07200 [Stenotrophomonas sp. HITSZ_GD]|uniref:hypothetical protein n=1 Tax=Stenotrophomonas sp. HITSZ_GD TaxID=3037248 RepID=UPI00102A0028|nr:hypothetical protein [Stenotrophomonas sp. HITSZ_GD]MDG2525139.1 hypothetical protein [Stenotrophomonas sp. HITSZ_GD]
MDAIELNFERELFSADVLARTAHRYSRDYFVDLSAAGANLVVRLQPKAGVVLDPMLSARFHNDALDDRLRAQVSSQTSDLHAALIHAALSEAWPHGRRRE